MTSQEFTQHIGILLSSNPDSEYLDLMLQQIHTAHENLKKIVGAAAGVSQANHSALVQSVAGLQTFLNAVSSQLRPLRTRTVWAGVNELQSKLEKFSKSEHTAEVAHTISEYLEIFSHAYEEFVKTYTAAQTFAVIDSGNDLFQSIEAVRLTAKLAANALAPATPADTSDTELNLFLGSTQYAIGFADKLNALIGIYQELCELLNIPTASHPLQIGKIESGSLWGQFFGESKVIGLMVRLIESSARYLHRNYTTEGKIAAMPRRIEAIEAVLGLKRSLNEQGLNTSEMEEPIEKSSILIAQKLNALLIGESHVVVNAIEISVSQEILKNNELTGGQGLLEDEVEPEVQKIERLDE